MWIAMWADRRGPSRGLSAPPLRWIVLVVSAAREARNREWRAARRKVCVHDEEQLAHAGNGGGPAERRIRARVDEQRARGAVLELEEAKRRWVALHDYQPPAVAQQPVSAG